MKKVNENETREINGGAKYYTYCGGCYGEPKWKVMLHYEFCSLCHYYRQCGNPVNGNKTYCYYK